MAFESPFSQGIASWWSDCYGECPRMFYHAFAGVPEWAPPGENHILYSEGILKDVSYASMIVKYTTTNNAGTEYLRLSFKPKTITLNNAILELRADLNQEGYIIKSLGKGDYAVTLKHISAGKVVIK
jgi:hypothetical protein